LNKEELFKLIKKSSDSGSWLADRRSLLIEERKPHHYFYFSREVEQPKIPASELALFMGIHGWKIFRAVCTKVDDELDYCWAIALKPDYTDVQFVEGKASELGLK